MYNGIGLSTPRGSGTSGYIQKNMSMVRPQKSREEFLKDLQQLRENVLPPPKKANRDILLHKQKRSILLHLEKLRQELHERGTAEEEIEERLKTAEAKLNEMMEKGELDFEKKEDTHQQAIAKEREYERMRRAFAMSEDYRPGSAFDFEGQEKKKLEKVHESEKRKEEERQIRKEKKRAEREREKEREQREKERAVSYTHLTLPTIYSV
eukprot:TRINITY_DN3997_c0_g1_i5.p1 TRINITY_DN3997_c0_g1~~TRINITY_DN3997_c0_g1_i5.p1  ORF type:complete len:209 (+),score=70.67 TRINITY_DN3997_c0_g1_i5:44-670(+)